MHDGIEIERRGIPAAVICTEPFITSARVTAELWGIPTYPFAVITHPLASATAAELQARAEAALPQVLRLLLRDSPAGL